MQLTLGTITRKRCCNRRVKAIYSLNPLLLDVAFESRYFTMLPYKADFSRFINFCQQSLNRSLLKISYELLI